MNQVQEMLRLASADKADEAVLRLSHLFQMMSEQPGFIAAEVLRNGDDAAILLVLHAWRDLADWQTFQNSTAKLNFTASRPEALYNFVACGMNWRSSQADGAREGALLRREVIRDESLPLRSGDGVAGCQTYVFADDEPATYAGCALRLTRLPGPQRDATPGRNRGLEPSAWEAASGVLADETYESLLTVRASGIVVAHAPL